MKNLLLCAALMIATASSATAATRDQLWDTYIGGKQSLPFKIEGLLEWLTPSSPACGEQQKQILDLIDKYSKAAYKSKDGKAQEFAGALHAKLLQLYSSSDPCTEDVSEAYLMGSVWVSDGFNQSHLSSLVATGCDTDCTHGPPLNLYLLLLTKALLKAGAVHFTVPQSCDIEFAYLCDPGAIVLNPVSKPISEGGIYGSSPDDFAGHFLHEVDHLFRDKYVSPDYVRSRFPDSNDPSGIDWKSYLLLDETLAKIIAGSEEISNQRQESWNASPNHLHGDFTLYAQGGPLEKLWKDPDSGASQIMGFGGYSMFLRDTFLHAGYDYPETSSIKSDLFQIYEALQNSYFPGVDADGSSIRLDNPASPLDPVNQDMTFEPLAAFLSDHGWGINPYLPFQSTHLSEEDVWRGTNTIGIEIGPLPIPIYKTKSNIVVPIRWFLDQIAELVDTLKTPTIVCQLFNQRLAQSVASQAPAAENPMGSYFGGSCMKNGSSGERPDGAQNDSTNAATKMPQVSMSNMPSKIPTEIWNKSGMPAPGMPHAPIPNHLPSGMENGGRTDNGARP